ncbi:MAG: 50S ribosomal protein L7Ae-like protein [Firmicutes bacterium]|nr:50S ribosomal protein L7Ae-like protein [Bacillota bacterium]
MDVQILKDPSRRVVGAKQTLKALAKGSVALVLMAEDADARVTKPIEDKCIEQQVQLKKVPSMRELGAACAIQVGAAVVGILKQDL